MKTANALIFGSFLVTELMGQNFGNVPLYFEENRGQTDPHARYIARSSSQVGFITQDGWTLSLHGQPISMHITSADPKVALNPENPIEGISNSTWAPGRGFVGGPGHNPGWQYKRSSERLRLPFKNDAWGLMREILQWRD